MKALKLKYITVVALASLCACSEEVGYREPSGSSEIPELVSNVTVSNYAGKSTIHYELPNDPNLLYVKAVYSITNGKQLESKSSYYVDSLVVEGFADQEDGAPYEVTLYSVNRQDQESEPVTITVNPLQSPIWPVLESIDVQNAFGGFKLSASNESEQAVGILILEKNLVGEWEVDNNLSVYSSNKEIASQVAGMDTIVHDYGIVVRDRWGNLTDTIFQEVLPIYETEISRAAFAHYPLPGDVPMVSNGGIVRALWDNRYGWPVCFTSLDASYSSQPAIVTIDMGLDAKVSKVWLRPFQEISGLFYDYCTPKYFELYGSVAPNPSGELDGTWTLLGTYELKKPSNSPGKTETPADQEAARAGFFFEVDLDAPRLRYLRIKNLQNWSGFGTLALDELRVYGDPR